MDAASIFTMAREMAWDVSATNPKFTDAALLKYANLVRHEIENAIISRVDEDFFYRKFTVDTVANQSEYSFQTSTALQIGMKKILSCGIKYTSEDTYFKNIKPSNTVSKIDYIDNLAANQSYSDAFFTLKNSSLFIYPAPTEAVTNWLTVEAIVTLLDIAADSIESLIFPNSELRDYHYIIALGIVPYIHRILKQYNDVQVAKNEYLQAIEKMITEVGERWDSITEWHSPSWREYM